LKRAHLAHLVVLSAIFLLLSATAAHAYYPSCQTVCQTKCGSVQCETPTGHIVWTTCSPCPTPTSTPPPTPEPTEEPTPPPSGEPTEPPTGGGCVPNVPTFSVNPTNPKVGQMVTFQVDNPSSIVTPVNWDFGDTEHCLVDCSGYVAHTYKGPIGKYHVILTATETNCGTTTFAAKDIIVWDTLLPRPTPSPTPAQPITPTPTAIPTPGRAGYCVDNPCLGRCGLVQCITPTEQLTTVQCSACPTPIPSDPTPQPTLIPPPPPGSPLPSCATFTCAGRCGEPKCVDDRGNVIVNQCSAACGVPAPAIVIPPPPPQFSNMLPYDGRPAGACHDFRCADENKCGYWPCVNLHGHQVQTPCGTCPPTTPPLPTAPSSHSIPGCPRPELNVNYLQEPPVVVGQTIGLNLGESASIWRDDTYYVTFNGQTSSVEGASYTFAAPGEYQFHAAAWSTIDWPSPRAPGGKCPKWVTSRDPSYVTVVANSSDPGSGGGIAKDCGCPKGQEKVERHFYEPWYIANGEKGDVLLMKSVDETMAVIMGTMGQWFTHTMIMSRDKDEISHFTAMGVDRQIQNGIDELGLKIHGNALANLADGHMTQSVDWAKRVYKMKNVKLLKPKPEYRATAQAAADYLKGMSGRYKLEEFTQLSYHHDSGSGAMCASGITIAFNSVQPGSVNLRHYPQPLRSSVAAQVHALVKSKIKNVTDIGDAWTIAFNWLWGGLTFLAKEELAENVANQIVNCFSNLGCGNTSRDWEDPAKIGEGFTVAPDDLLTHSQVFLPLQDPILRGGQYKTLLGCQKPNEPETWRAVCTKPDVYVGVSW
jgi:hypothetical protein